MLLFICLLYYIFLFKIGYFEENIVLHFASSMISGLVTTAASMPVDIAKTRYTISFTYNSINILSTVFRFIIILLSEFKT